MFDFSLPPTHCHTLLFPEHAKNIKVKYIFSPLLSPLMQLFDTDEDEKITREEFTALLRSALGVSDLNMAKLFKEIDADGSGFITFSE